MDNSQKTLRDQIRLWKNHWIKQYLNYRVYNNPEPFSIALKKRPCRVLWILSHMRSGSSLLTHILNANPEIIGYGETHITYRSPQDYKQLIKRVYWEGQDYRKLSDLPKLAFQEKYVLDKILHNDRLPNLDLLAPENVRVLFLAREPRRSLMSIRDLKPNWSEAEALGYYCNRLKTLITYAETIDSKERSLLVQHDQLINKSALVFESLQHFLSTDTRFTENYGILKTTGKKHVGDHRGNILTGQIVRSQRKIDQTVSPAILDEAQLVYQQFLQKMEQLSSVIESNIQLDIAA
ncbi:MAG: sulfotransferase family protein [Cyanobacteria bacterium J06638_28]